METHFSKGACPQPYLPHNGAEFEGRTPPDAVTTEIAVENALSTIREILIEQRRDSSRRSLPDLSPQIPVEFIDPLPSRQHAIRQSWTEFFKRQGSAFLARLVRPESIFWISVFSLVIWQPLLVMIVLFVSYWVVLLGVVIFGRERLNKQAGRLLMKADEALRACRDMIRNSIPPRNLPEPIAEQPDPFERIRR